MKKNCNRVLFLFVSMTMALALIGCLPGGYSHVQYTMIKNQIPYNVKRNLVDINRVQVGEYMVMRTQKPSRTTESNISIVAKESQYLIIERLIPNWVTPFRDKTMGIAMKVDKKGNVKEAWGGLLGMEMVPLDVPKTPEPPEKAPKVKPVALDTRTIANFRAKGRRWGKGTYSTSKWENSKFPFQNGLLRIEAGARKSEVIKHKKSGAVSKVPRPAKKE